MPADFVHLHTHSYYSFLTGVPSPHALVEAAQQHGMKSLALTDQHGLTGALEFYDACHAAGVQPLLGLEVQVTHALGDGRLVFLAQDLSGWGSLCRLSSAVQTRPDRHPERGLPFETLAENTAGLLCLTGGRDGLAWRLLAQGEPAAAGQFLDTLQALFPQALYVELHWQRPVDEHLVHPLAALARTRSLPLVATNNVHYLRPAQAGLQRTLSAMRLNQPLPALLPEAAAPDGSHFASAAEMAARFAAYPEALAHTQEIATRCHLELPLGQPHYPAVPLPPGETAQGKLHQLAEQGARQRYGPLTPAIRTRLAHELQVIATRGYAPLFLIMQDILAYARQTGVPTASRGSAASSLVAHCLGITTPDPLALDLYFERFLNPARSSPPDIDTDLCSVRREGVLQYVYTRYGTDRVAMVATINRFRRRSALREVAKAHGLSPAQIKTLTANLPARGWGPPARRATQNQPPFADLQAQYPAYQAIFETAAALLGFPRHLSVHPGGIVIAPGMLTDLAPVHLASKGLRITQFDLEGVKRLGLVKIDLLGIRGLTVLGDVAAQVRAWRSAEFTAPLDVLEAIPAADPATAELVRTGQTIGCFQIESPGMRTTLQEIDAHSPADLMIALALYRPGPLTGGLKDAFVRRHLGQEQSQPLHPALAVLLQETHGVILYQEQVLRIASELAGLSLADADLLRRAMSHFDPGDRMKTLQERFVTGAWEKSRVPPEKGAEIWALMAAFAGYGFPKAHAASYAQLAWRSAWSKAHYPAVFMAAVLAGWGGYYRQRVYLSEARRLGLTVRPPHLNHAQRQFSVAYPGGQPVLFMGLAQVKGLTRRTQRRILAARPFHTLSDFLTRVDPRPEEAARLVQVGALAGLGRRAPMLAQITRGGWRAGQPPLFPEEDAPSAGETWSLAEQVAAQKDLLGVALAAHPVELIAERLAQQGVVSTQEAQQKLGSQVRVAGVRQTGQRFHPQQGDAYYYLEMEDAEGVLGVGLPLSLYRRSRALLSSRAPFVVTGVMVERPGTRTPMLQAKRVEKG